MDVLRLLAPPVLAVVTALALDHESTRRGLQPPGLVPGHVPSWRARRMAAALGLTLAFYLVVYQPLAAFGLTLELDPATLPRWQLFAVHAILAVIVVLWCALGFCGVAGLPARRQPAVWAGQLGLLARRPATELALGVAVGVLAWAAVLVTMLLVALVLTGLGLAELVPRQAPLLVATLGGLPWWLRLLLSASAGLAEEVFFRGFLQPRVGLAVSTALFAMAHLGYQQVFLLLGVTLLSLCFGALSAWRQNVWAAVAAHATFDAIQLLWIVPAALEAASGKS